jgi:hypothetical protein
MKKGMEEKDNQCQSRRDTQECDAGGYRLERFRLDFVSMGRWLTVSGGQPRSWTGRGWMGGGDKARCLREESLARLTT